MTKIIGVDFSGAKDENKSATWLAEGRLEAETLTIEHCHPIIRADLTRKLLSLDGPAVVAMDFPFSMPVEFANFWLQQDVLAAGWEMPSLWAAAAGIELEQFKDLRDEFVPQHGELRRAGDPPEAISPLNLRMRPMTLRGMQMLSRLRQRTAGHEAMQRFQVAPLQPDLNLDVVTLLEIMPGVTLDRFRINRTGYKENPEIRQGVLTKLFCKSRREGLPVRFADRAGLYQICRASDDATDAIIAAVTSALWVIDQPGRGLFVYPPDAGADGHDRTMFEGWLYAPQNPVG